MADVKWIKVTTDIFDDEKILLIESMPEADSIIVIWFKLLTLTGKINQSGLVVFNGKMPYTDEMLATIFRRPLNIVRMALNVFEQFGMIEIINDVIAVPNWEKHQNIDGLDKIREQTRERVARHRNKQKLLECNVTGNVTVTDGNATDKDKEKDKDKDINNKKTSKRFVPPSVDELSAYIKEKGYHFDAESFIAHYESNGWMVGRNKMKSWKSACVTWEKNRYGQTSIAKEEPKPRRYREFDAEPEVDAVAMPDEIRNKLKGIF